MHKNSQRIMSDAVARYACGDTGTVLDVGALNVNGTYKAIWEKAGWVYTGLDVAAGDNVDVIAENPLIHPFPDAHFDAVITGQCLEHSGPFWLIAREMVRELRPGGLLICIVPFVWPIHRYPKGCWRFAPDGLDYLFSSWCSLDRQESGLSGEPAAVGHVDCFYVGRKLTTGEGVVKT